MTLAGYGAAATAGAVTVGLIAGVAHNGTHSTSTSSGTTSTTTTSTTTSRHGDDGGNSDDDGNSGNIQQAPQNGVPAGGSHGS